MRYHEIKEVLKEDGDAGAACGATAGATTSASVATVVSAFGAPAPTNKKKKSKPVVLKRTQ